MSSKTKKLGVMADLYKSENMDGTITKIKINKVHPSSEQPRQDRTRGVDDLAASLKKDGLLSPVIVTREADDTFRIIAGERRYHAMKKLKWQEIECRIISREERDYWRIAIIENLQRENLSPEEEAIALARLKKQENHSDAELAELVGKSRNYVTEIIGIANLPQETLEQARTAGIDNKNLLIQVVQAQKSGNVDEFLDAYKQGEFKTVRAAKDFVQSKKSGGEHKSTTSSAAKTLQGERKSFKIKVSGNKITIECPDKDELRKAEKFLRSKYPE